VFAGFDPQAGQPFFERKRWQSLLGAVLLVGGSLGTAFYMASLEVEEPVEEEIVEAEIQNFELEEELEEPEPEPPPPPEPPSSKPAKRSNKPTPQPDIQNPDAIDENPEEGDVNSAGPEYGGGGGGSGDGGGGTQKPEPEPEPEPEPKPKPKSDKFPYNPDKPIERPADATVPKQVGGNPPVYPAELRKRNITGKVKVRLTIYKDGSVKGAFERKFSRQGRRAGLVRAGQQAAAQGRRCRRPNLDIQAVNLQRQADLGVLDGHDPVHSQLIHHPIREENHDGTQSTAHLGDHEHPVQDRRRSPGGDGSGHRLCDDRALARARQGVRQLGRLRAQEPAFAR
jgi:hypothetical protein